METLGFLEISCYVKKMASTWEGDIWDPLAECGMEEARKLLDVSFKRWTESEKSIRFFMAVKNFGLSQKEAYLVFMMTLPCLNRDFKKAFEWISQDKTGSIPLILDMYEKNHDGNGEMIRLSFLNEWFLQEEAETESVQMDKWLAFWLAGYEHAYINNYSSGDIKLEEIISEEGYAAKEAMRLSQYMEQEANAQEIFYLYGPWGAGKRTCAAIAAQKMKRPLLITDLSQWKREETDTGKKIVRETVLAGGILCITGYHLEHQKAVKNMIHISNTILQHILVIGEGSPAEVEADAGWLAIPFGVPDMSFRYAMWRKEAGNYPLDSQVSLQQMANKYFMTPGQIQNTMKLAWKLTRYLQKEVIGQEELAESCHQFLKGRFGRSVKKVEGVFRWDDLVLPKRQKEKLNAACDQLLYRHLVLEQWNFQQKMVYGTGISMVFAGPPGTGKTMAAQVIARRLGMELYKVELASVVSKFIGETEKNLEEIFEQARKSQVILFFDEADVLFGKRTEVRDSNDKYSNMEAAFLLQKMEEYPGVVILATNLIQNMDEAFKRRMKFVIDFPFPDSSQRLEIWKKSIPSELPVEAGLDLQFLAEHFELSGSNIKNVIYQGAFFAASGTGVLGMKELLQAIRNEYEKSGHVVSRQDMGPYSILFE